MSKYIEKDLVQQTAVLALTHNWTMNQIYTALMILPSEDMIRCKDCRYYQDNNGGYPNADCKWCKDETPDANDYCSCGERKDDEVHKNG